MAKSMFDSYGGFAKVRRIVGDFYDRLVESDDLATYFRAVDMRSLVDHQTKFVAQVMGGPASYTDEALQRIHSRLDIQPSHFDELAMLLKETLEDHELAEDDVTVVCNQIFGRKHLICASAIKRD